MAPQSSNPAQASDPFACFHPVTAAWFKAVFDAPTAPQRLGWPVIARGENALILAPTGTGKTLAAFLWCLDRLMLEDREQVSKGAREREDREQGTGIRDQKTAGAARKGCRIVYVSPLKALAVDVERNLRSPLAGMANMARRMGVAFREPEISVRTGDTPQASAPASRGIRPTSSSPRQNRSTCCSRRRRPRLCARWKPSLWTRFTRWCPPSAERTFP